MIKLEDFVAETLRQIIGGVKQAQTFAAEHGARVVPASMTFRTDQGPQLWDKFDGTPIQAVEFDVAVTTIEGTATKGGIGVFVGPVGLGSQGQSNASSQSVSRVKFNVPIIFSAQSKHAQPNVQADRP